jgi:molecular chaperone DnaK
VSGWRWPTTPSASTWNGARRSQRTFVHHTIETVSAGAVGAVLAIPIVQGELQQAHLCRLVGKLEIAGTALRGPLPAGSEVQVTVEVDRGGRLAASALIPGLSQAFEGVAHLVIPDADPEALAAQLPVLRERLAAARRRVEGDPRRQDRLIDVEWWLDDAVAALANARGGDEDAGQKARRLLIDADAALNDVEEEVAWPELEAESAQLIAAATMWTARLGTPDEQEMLGRAVQAVRQAQVGRRPGELHRHLRIVNQLGRRRALP